MEANNICICHGDQWTDYTTLLEHQVHHFSREYGFISTNYALLYNMVQNPEELLRGVRSMIQERERQEKKEEMLKRKEEELRHLQRQLERETRKLQQREVDLRILEVQFDSN